MSDDKPDLVQILKLEDFEEDDEVILIHTTAGYAVHGLVLEIDERNSMLGVSDRIKLDYIRMEIEGRAGMRTKAPNVDATDPMALYEFLRDCKGYRTNSTFIFPGKGLIKAYKIVEKKPEAEPVVEPPAEPSAESGQSL